MSFITGFTTGIVTGMIIGGLVGIAMMCIFFIAKESDKHNDIGE